MRTGCAQGLYRPASVPALPSAVWLRAGFWAFLGLSFPVNSCETGAATAPVSRAVVGVSQGAGHTARPLDLRCCCSPWRVRSRGTRRPWLGGWRASKRRSSAAACGPPGPAPAWPHAQAAYAPLLPRAPAPDHRFSDPSFRTEGPAGRPHAGSRAFCGALSAQGSTGPGGRCPDRPHGTQCCASETPVCWFLGGVSRLRQPGCDV